MNKELEDLVDLMFDTDMEEVMKEKSTLEYIHKLQYENKQLKEDLKELFKENEENKEYSEFYKDMSDKWKDMSDVFKKSWKDYKTRIDKAIEYIKTHSEMTDLQICGIENVLAFRGSATKLLEILGDKE